MLASSANRGIHPILVDPSGRPSFVTVNRTGGVDAGHIDVSLWYLLVDRRGTILTIDVTEFNEARWWSPVEVQGHRPREPRPALPEVPREGIAPADQVVCCDRPLNPCSKVRDRARTERASRRPRQGVAHQVAFLSAKRRASAGG
jgi:hypothetical protein